VSTPLPRHEFAVTERYVYLNHAAVGVLPRSCAASLGEFVNGHAEAGVLGTFTYEAKMPQYRDAIGRFIGANGADIAVTGNTSAGANAIALGLQWQPGDRVALPASEFPANSIPWLALRRLGVEVDLIEERLTPDVLRRSILPRTRVVAVSWVAYADGYRHDLAALAEVAHANGALFCVDAIQGLGAFPLDVDACAIDALYCGAAKWMLGLQGVGFLYVRPSLRDRLNPATPGWRSVADMWDFHNYEQPYAGDASRYEGGTPSFIGALSMASSIAFFERYDRAAVAQHILLLTDRLVDGLRAVGATILTERGEGISSGIVTFSMPGCESVALGRALQREGIVTTWRPAGIRVAPHGYNDLPEIDRLLALLPECAGAVAAKA
jgi:selenocysteine lyase/cysteine desulfurase